MRTHPKLHPLKMVFGILVCLLTACNSTSGVFSNKTSSIDVTSSPGLFEKTKTQDITPTSSDCSSSALVRPGVFQFEPIDGEGAIAYTGEGVSLFFPRTGKNSVLHPTSKIGLSGIEHQFSWAPDGTRLAFLYEAQGPAACHKGYLMIADLVQGKVYPAVASVHSFSRPAWSFNGEYLATVNENGQLVVIEMKSGSARVLQKDAVVGVAPQWIADEQVAYVRDINRDGQNFMQLVKQDLTGGSPSILIDESEANDLHIEGAFAVSPDQKKLAYSYAGNVYLVDLSSGSKESVSLSDFPERLQWSSDRRILMGRVGMAGIFLIHVEDLNVENLPTHGLIEMQSWSPDGQSLSLLQGDVGLHTFGIYHLSTRQFEPIDMKILPPYEWAWNPQ